MSNCPRCRSTAPHMHPAVQSGGEVEVCTDPFHLLEAQQNRPEYIRAVEEARSRAAFARLCGSVPTLGRLS